MIYIYNFGCGDLQSEIGELPSHSALASWRLCAINIPPAVCHLFVEGRERDVLAGGAKCIADLPPIRLVEMVKTDKDKLRAWLEELGYSVFAGAMNFLAMAGVSLMRIVFLLLAMAFLTACATQPNVGAGGQSDGRASQGAVRVGVPF